MHKVEAKNPVLCKWGTQEGRGSQWCNRLPRWDPRGTRERRCDFISEQIRGFMAGEKITVPSTLGHETSGMDHTEVRSLLGNGYRLDLVSVPNSIVLRRKDGTEVTRFSVWDATSKAIEQAAQEDRRTNQKV